jgi:catechol 2,3-dioxygenase-like lactoylglutathione lyase family enzyme
MVMVENIVKSPIGQYVEQAMRFVCTLITVENIEKSKWFYEIVLRQKIKYDFEQNILFESGISIHLKSHFNSIPGFESFQIQPGSKNIELYFEDEYLQKAEAELEKYGIKFIHKIQEQPWKQLVFRVLDPDGYIVEIGESMETLVKRLHGEGLNAQEISNATGLPEDFILNTLAAL